MNRTRKRDELIRVGRELIVRQGFNATGLSDILNTAGVPKGSFYYYFESKEDFGLAIVEQFAEEYQKKLDTTIGNRALDPLVRMARYFALGIEELERNDYETGCLVGNLAQELAAQNEIFRDRLNQIFDDWEAQFASCVEQAVQLVELKQYSSSTELARFILAGWQGAMLRAKVARSSEPLRMFVQVLFAQVFEQSVPIESIAG